MKQKSKELLIKIKLNFIKFTDNIWGMILLGLIFFAINIAILCFCLMTSANLLCVYFVCLVVFLIKTVYDIDKIHDEIMHGGKR